MRGRASHDKIATTGGEGATWELIYNRVCRLTVDLRKPGTRRARAKKRRSDTVVPPPPRKLFSFVLPQRDYIILRRVGH
jgi:hypothetical protein